MSAEYPKTIKHPDTFSRKPSASFDGVFNWEWTDGCFGETKIKPTDIDGIVERRGNFIVFETKDPGKEIPRGQQILLRELHKTGRFTIMIIYGKQNPEYAEVYYPGCEHTATLTGEAECQDFVRSWYNWADKKSKKQTGNSNGK
jgi:hypothetical protein